MRGRTRRGQPEWKWQSYAVLLLLSFFLQRCVCNRLPVAGAVPWLLPLAVAALGFWEGPRAGALAGIGAGLLEALTGGLGGAALIWQEMLIGLCCGATLRQPMGRTLWGYLLCAAGSLVFLEGGQVLAQGLFLHQAWLPLCRVAGREALYSLPFALILYPAFRGLYLRYAEGRVTG